MLKCVKIGGADLQVRTKTIIFSANTEGVFTISKYFSDGLLSPPLRGNYFQIPMV